MQMDELLGKMTLWEKISLLSGKDVFTSKALPRLQIPSICFSDGPHGIRKQLGDADHLGIHQSCKATCFPTAVGMAVSWNTELIEQIGECLGEEAASLGVNVLLGPGLNIKRNPLCGRSFEYFSEDPYLSGKLAAAYIRGVQRKGVAACPKHFAVNSQENRRMVNNSIVDERTLHEIYLTGFEIAVKEGSPQAIMTSYNKINGIYSNENRELLMDILRRQWKFQGAVITDWGGSNDHVEGVRAGSSIEMPGTGGDSDRQLLEAVKRKDIEEKVIDQRASEMLKLIEEAGNHRKDAYSVKEHHEMAYQAALESMVLLKNEDNLLPLRKGARAAVIGEFAEKPRYQGAGSSLVNPTCVEHTMKHLKESGLNVVGYAKGYERGKASVEAWMSEAEKLADVADVVLYYMGLEETSECEGKDREDLAIPENQRILLERLSNGKRKIAVILSSGSVVDLAWEMQAQTILYTTLAGQAQARAVVDIITGKSYPCGKLTETWPVCYEDTPAASYYKKDQYDSLYKEALYVGYRYYSTVQQPVRFPFGYGLSYTDFRYEELQISSEGVTFEITNAGSYDGAEIAQLYVGKPEQVPWGPGRELKGFVKVWLKAGEKRTVKIVFDDKTFRYYNTEKKAWITPKAEYEILVGANVEDIRLRGRWIPEGTTESWQSKGKKVPFPYTSGQIRQIPDQEFEALLGHEIVRTEHETGAPLRMNDAICKMADADSAAARAVFRIIRKCKERGEQKEIPDLNILFIYNLPFRGIAKMMNGKVSLQMTGALLTIVNGELGKGLKNLIKGYLDNRKYHRNEQRRKT